MGGMEGGSGGESEKPASQGTVAEDAEGRTRASHASVGRRGSR